MSTPIKYIYANLALNGVELSGSSGSLIIKNSSGNLAPIRTNQIIVSDNGADFTLSVNTAGSIQLIDLNNTAASTSLGGGGSSQWIGTSGSIYFSAENPLSTQVAIGTTAPNHTLIVQTGFTTPTLSTTLFDFNYALRVDGPGNELIHSISTNVDNGFYFATQSDNITVIYNTNASLIQQTVSNMSIGSFIGRSDSIGNLLWTTRVDGTDVDIIRSVSTSFNDGSVYFGGGYNSTQVSFYNTNGTTIQSSLGNITRGTLSAFVAKIGSTGNLLWANRIDGINNDVVNSIISDDNGGVSVLVNYKSLQLNYYTTNGNVVATSGKLNLNYTQVEKLIAGDAAASDEFGYSVSLNADGNTVLIGANLEDANGLGDAGSAYVFTRNASGIWTQQAKLIAADAQAGDNFGYSVSLNADGNTALIGAYLENGSAGSAYVFTRSGTGIWTQQAKLIANDAQANDWFGYSVSLNADGNTALIGAILEDANGLGDAGSAYVFTRNGSGIWTQQAKLIANDAQASDQFGCSVSLNADGNTALIGARAEDANGITDAGSAYVFTRSGTTWTQQAKLIAADAASGDQFGYSVSLNADGNTALISAIIEDPNGIDAAGSAYVFVRSGTTWTQQAKLIAADAQASDLFGYSVSLNADGNTALIGAVLEDANGITDAGSAYVFTRNSATGIWTQQAKLIAADAEARDQFGYSVSLNADGNTALIGAREENPNGIGNAGSAYVFNLDSSSVIARYSSTGSLLFNDRFDGFNDNDIHTLAHSVVDNGIYFGGMYSSSQLNIFNTNGVTIQQTLSNLSTIGTYASIIGKLNSSGSLLWVSRIDGVGNDYISDIAYAYGDNGIFFNSVYNSTELTLFATNGTTVQQTIGNPLGALQGVIGKYGSSGTLLWTSQLSGILTTLGSASGTTDGGVFITCSYVSTGLEVYATNGMSIQATLENISTVSTVLLRYDSVGNLLYATRIQGENTDVEVEGGNVYISGVSTSTQVNFYNGVGVVVSTMANTSTDGNLVSYVTKYTGSTIGQPIITVNNTLEFTTIGNLNLSGSMNILGNLSVAGTKNFRIPHPVPEKRALGMSLLHSALETPTAGDNLYRYRVQTLNYKSTIYLPDYFSYLNKDVQIICQALKHFGQAYGEYFDSDNKIEITSNQDGIFDIFVIGTRKDTLFQLEEYN